LNASEAKYIAASNIPHKMVCGSAPNMQGNISSPKPTFFSFLNDIFPKKTAHKPLEKNAKRVLYSFLALFALLACAILLFLLGAFYFGVLAFITPIAIIVLQLKAIRIFYLIKSLIAFKKSPNEYSGRIIVYIFLALLILPILFLVVGNLLFTPWGLFLLFI
jgi:nitrate reductase NapE component